MAPTPTDDGQHDLLIKRLDEISRELEHLGFIATHQKIGAMYAKAVDEVNYAKDTLHCIRFEKTGRW